jgi:DNA modification methylase
MENAISPLSKTYGPSLTVHYSDARDMREVADESVDFFITSPPYWNLKDYGPSENEIGDTSYEEYLGQLKSVFSQCYAKAKVGAAMVVNINSRRHKGRFYPIAMDIVRVVKDWEFWDQNIWYIPNALPQPNAYMERLLDNKFESLLVFIKGGHREYEFHKPRVPQKYAVADPRAEKKNERGRCLGNVLRIPAYRPPNVREMNYHVAAYPEELVAFFLETYTSPGDVVLDPFLGSGTTLKVCSVMGRKGIGFEVHEEFEPLIAARLAEPWEVPDWKKLDIIHSSSSQPGSAGGPRKAQFHTKAATETLFD